MAPSSSSALLDRQDCVLVLIDMQERLMPAMAAPDKALARARLAVQAMHELQVPILLTEQYPERIGPTVSEIFGVLPPDLTPVAKLSFGCLGEPEFCDRLQNLNRKTLIVAGVETHVCVLQTVLGALAEGYRVHLVADACSSRDPENAQLALERMRTAGATITSAETVIFELLGCAGTDEFRRIHKLLK